MAVVEKHAPGTFCWVELGTTDEKGAREFYSNLFGWSAAPVPMGEGQSYTLFQIEGRDTGGMYALNQGQCQQGVPPHWLLYVCVEDADAIVKTVPELGGAVVAGPFDVFDIGRMAVLKDPQGAVFAVWQPRQHIGTGISCVHGTLCWSELATTDAGKAREFYTRLFGWGAKISQFGPTEYTEWQGAGCPVGGMLQMTAEWGNIPPHWMPYFRVDDCDASAARASASGAQVKVPPSDIPSVGRFAVLADPQGAHLSIIKLSHM